MSNEVDIRVSLDLDPGVVETLPHYQEEAVYPVLRATDDLMRTAHATLRAIHDAKAAAETDPTLTPEARLLKVDDYASKRMEPVTKAWDRTVGFLEGHIREYEKELTAPVVAKASQMVSGEVRNHIKNLPLSERMGAIQKAIRDGDEAVATAVLGAPAMLSGLDPDMQAELLREWGERTNPTAARRLRAARAAYDMLNEKGSLLHREKAKAVGVIEVRKELRGGRSVVSETITPQAIRQKRDKANASFAFPES